MNGRRLPAVICECGGFPVTDGSVNGWGEALKAFDLSRPIIHGQATKNWEGELVRELTQCDLINELPPATCIACTECGESPIRDVIFTESANGRQRALFPCPDCGLYEVPLSDLRRWQLDQSRLAQSIRESLALSVRLDEVVPDRLWRLGRWKRTGINMSVWLGLQSWRRNIRERLSPSLMRANSLLLVPNRRPLFPMPEGVVIGVLTELTEWHNGHLEWDEEELSELLGTNRPANPRPTKPAPIRRQTRAADIEALVGELREHLRAARDFAFHTLETNGVAELLPRPSQKDLAQRLGITSSRVSRSINDEDAQQLKLLWKLADDIDGIMRYGR